MLILDRDRQIVLSVGSFRQVTSGHLQTMHFSGLHSSTPLYRALDRLVERRYLARIERRMIGGTGAGSGQYVYQLGSRGWEMCRMPGRYWPARSVDYHTLAVADVYVELLRIEREGRIRIEGRTTEPESHVTIAGADLRPDLYVEVAELHRQRNRVLWVEVDMGTERAPKIRDKLAKYWHAYQHADETTLPVFPLVLFIAPDDMRARELRWLIEQGPEQSRDLFLVSVLPEFGGLLFS